MKVIFIKKYFIGVIYFYFQYNFKILKVKDKKIMSKKFVGVNENFKIQKMIFFENNLNFLLIN